MKKIIFTATLICTLTFGVCGISANDNFETYKSVYETESTADKIKNVAKKKLSLIHI